MYGGHKQIKTIPPTLYIIPRYSRKLYLPSLPGTLFLHHIYIETQRRKTAHGNATPQSSHKPPTTPPQETTRPFYLSHLYFFMNLRVSSMVSFRPLASSSCFSAIILARAACAFTACMYRTRQAASISICVC